MQEKLKKKRKENRKKKLKRKALYKFKNHRFLIRGKQKHKYKFTNIYINLMYEN